MGEFTDRILELLPEVRREREKREQEEARIAAAQAKQAAILERVRQEDLSKATRLGREVVELLQGRAVPKLPIYERVDNGPVRQTGQGWHVATISTFMGTDADPGSTSFALSENGTVVEFSKTSFKGMLRHGDEQVVYRGIIFPTAFEGSKAVRMIENPTFQRGVASLIDSRQPYSDPVVYDY